MYSVRYQSKTARVYDKIARVCLYALIVLMPLMVLPWTADVLEVNKQALLILLTTAGTIAWLGAMVTEKRIHVVKSWTFLPAVILLAILAISSFASLAPVSSWLGQSMQEYTSFVTTISLALVCFLAANLLRDTTAQKRAWAVATFSSALIALVGASVALGVPLLDTLLIGTPNALAIYLTGLTVAICALWLTEGTQVNDTTEQGAMGMAARIAGAITVVGTLLTLLALDTWFLWVILLAGLISVFGFALLRAEEFPNPQRFVIPMLFAVVGTIFLFLPSPLGSSFPAEITPSYKGTWAITRSTIAESPKNWVIGSGPGTFVIDYAKYKDPSVNGTQLWDTRFDRGASHLLTLLAMTGVAGVLALLAFLVTIKVAALNVLTKEQVHAQWKMTFVAFSAWTVFATALIFYSSNITLLFFLWITSGMIIAHATKEAKFIPFSQSPRGALLATFFFVFLSVGLLTMLFTTASRYIADISFARATSQERTIEEIDQVILELDRAARMNRWNDHYYRTLSNALLLKSAQLVQNPEENAAQLQQFISLSITAARKAVELSPNNVVNWSFAGDVYREFMLIAENSGDLAIGSYDRAIELAPSNPKYYTAKARVYLTAAEQLAQFAQNEDEEVAAKASVDLEATLNSAIEALNKAVELKSDYGPAHYYLAGAYERQGNLAEAISRLELLRSANQLDVGIHFQLGLLYFKQGKADLAEASLKRAIEISPNYSNARWYLSAVYEQKGDINAAIAEVEKVKELNPDNALVNQRLERLQQGEGPEVPDVLPDPVEEGSLNEAVEEIPSTETIQTE